jgi:hypothetical protein
MNKDMDLVERQISSKMEKEFVNGVRAGYVGSPAYP